MFKNPLGPVTDEQFFHRQVSFYRKSSENFQFANDKRNKKALKTFQFKSETNLSSVNGLQSARGLKFLSAVVHLQLRFGTKNEGKFPSQPLKSTQRAEKSI